ncbi:hypothetical protein SprV_0301134300 [Sparganum proliferum]
MSPRVPADIEAKSVATRTLSRLPEASADQLGQLLRQSPRPTDLEAERPPRSANAQPPPTCPRCQRIFRAPIGLVGHLLTNCNARTTPSAVYSSKSALSSTPTANTDPTPEPLRASSYSIALTSATAAPVPTTTARNPGSQTNINPPANNASDVNSVHTCPHCDRTFTSHIGLVGHLRIYRTETGEPVHPHTPDASASAGPTAPAHSRTAWAY